MLRNRSLAVFLFLLAAAYLLSLHTWMVPLVAGVSWAYCRRTCRRLAWTVLVLLGLLVLSHSLSQIAYDRLQVRLDHPCTVEGWVHRNVQEDRYRSLTLLGAVLEDYRGHRLTMVRPFRAVVPAGLPMPEVRPGDRVRVTGMLKRHRVYRNPGTDRSMFYRSRHRMIYVSAPSGYQVEVTSTRIGDWIRKLDPFNLDLPYPAADILRGMVAGNRDALPDPFVERVRNLGIYHLFVVSGFHFGILFSAAYLFLLLIPVRRRVRQTLALVFLFVLLPVTGFTAPSMRAFLMIAIYLMFSLRDIAVPPADAVGLAGIALLIWQPVQVFDPGFLLSFLVSAAIVKSLDPEDPWWWMMLKIPFVAFLASMPVMLGWFHRLPLSGPLVNIILTPIVTVVFYLFLLVQMGLPLLQPLGALVTGMVLFIERVPAPQMTVSASPAVLFVGFGVITMFLLWKGARRHRALLVGTGIVLMLSFLPRFHGDRMMVPDTGQSQAVVLQVKGETWLVDAAGEWEARLGLIPFLQSSSVRKIDRLFLSHFDADHAGGVPDLLKEFPVGIVYLPDAGGPKSTACRIRSALDRFEIPIRLLSRDSAGELLLNDVPVRVVHPLSIQVPDRRSNRNSLGLELNVDGTRITLLGDLDGMALERVCDSLSPADILLAPHHGSRHAAIPGLRTAVKPELVIVACGRNNRFRFPSDAFLHLFQDTEIRTTADCGLIRVNLDPFTTPPPCTSIVRNPPDH